MIVQDIFNIFRRWIWLIVLCAIAGALISYLFYARIVPQYEAKAGVIVVRKDFDVTLEPRFVTVDDGQFAEVDATDGGLGTLAAIVKNETVAKLVYEDLADELPESIDSPDRVLPLISGTVDDGVIKVVVRSEDPILAKTVADAWAGRYAEYVNDIYTGRQFGNDLAAQTATAKSRYNETEEALVEFLIRDESAQIAATITEKQSILNGLLRERKLNSSAEFENMLNRKASTETILKNTLLLQRLLATGDSEISDSANALSLLYLRLATIQGLQVQGSGATGNQTSNALSLLFLDMAADQNAAADQNVLPEIDAGSEGETAEVDDTGEGGSVAASGGDLQIVLDSATLSALNSSSADMQDEVASLIEVLESQLVQYEQQIDALSLQGLESEETGEDATISSLLTQIAELGARRQNLSNELKELQRESNLQWSTYTLLANEAAELDIEATAADGSIVRFAIPASQAGRPVNSPPRQSAILGAFFGAIVGCAIAFGWELLDDKVRRREDVELVLELPLLSSVPRGNTEQDGVAIALSSTSSPYIEGIRTIRSRLDALSPPRRSFLVSSPAAKDGKSTIVANLAVTFARSGRKVIAVDGDLRQPQLHHLLGLTNNKGIAEYLEAGGSLLDDYLQSTEIGGLKCLSAGHVKASTYDMFSSQRISDIVERLLEQADIVLFDSAATSETHDALAIASGVEGVIVVLRPGSASVSDVQRLQEEITVSHGDVLGVVLNKV